MKRKRTTREIKLSEHKASRNRDESIADIVSGAQHAMKIIGKREMRILICQV